MRLSILSQLVAILYTTQLIDSFNFISSGNLRKGQSISSKKIPDFVSRNSRKYDGEGIDVSAFMDNNSQSFLDVVGAQNIALLLSGIAFYLYDNRPRGGTNLELVEVRKSELIPNNLGVFAKKIIPKGTSIGVYPGYAKDIDTVLASKKDEKAQQQAKKYLWSLSNRIVIDPTNSEGLVDLQLSYFGLIKIDTTLSRMNEPPMGCDCSVIPKIEGNEVFFVAERDIFPNEEIFIDYGRNFDRSDYNNAESYEEKQKEIARYNAQKLREKEDMNTLQPVVFDSKKDVKVDQSTALNDGFINKLNKKDKDFDASGILSPEDASNLFTQRGDAMFKTGEDSELIDSIIGKKKESPAKKEAPKTDDDDFMSSFMRQIGTKESADMSSDATAGIFEDLAKMKFPVSDDEKLKKLEENKDNVANQAVDVNIRKPHITPQKAEQLMKKLDDLTDEQVEEVFKKMRNALGEKIKDQIDQNKVIKGKEKMPKIQPIDEKVREKYSKEINDLENELEKMYNDPLEVWQNIMKNPEKYLEDLEKDD